MVKASYPASPKRVPNVARRSCQTRPLILAIFNAVLKAVSIYLIRVPVCCHWSSKTTIDFAGMFKLNCDP